MQVGLAGPSGSGKTIFSEKVQHFLPGMGLSVSASIALVPHHDLIAVCGHVYAEVIFLNRLNLSDVTDTADSDASVRSFHEQSRIQKRHKSHD